MTSGGVTRQRMALLELLVNDEPGPWLFGLPAETLRSAIPTVKQFTLRCRRCKFSMRCHQGWSCPKAPDSHHRHQERDFAPNGQARSARNRKQMTERIAQERANQRQS